jgi:5-methylcytosine-specific restriction endonuclease McrA
MNPKSKRNKRQQLLKHFGSCCFWCRKDLPANQLTLDHLIPKSRGGSNNFENLRLSCLSCNRDRGNDLFPPRQKKSKEMNLRDS